MTILLFSLSLIPMLLMAMVVHELGHLAIAKLSRAKVRGIPDRHRLEHRHQIFRQDQHPDNHGDRNPPAGRRKPETRQHHIRLRDPGH